MFALGVEVSGYNPIACFSIHIRPPPALEIQPSAAPRNGTLFDNPDSDGNHVIAVDYTKLKPEQLIERATGHGDDNMWLSWLVEAAREAQLSNCVACAAARPKLITQNQPH